MNEAATIVGLAQPRPGSRWLRTCAGWVYRAGSTVLVHSSLSALGWVLHPHPLAPGLGDGSPLSRLAGSGALTLLVGVGWDSATCLHLGEARSGVGRLVATGAPMTVNGQRRWVSWDDLDWDETAFPVIGTEIEKTGAVLTGNVGSATARLVRAEVAAGVSEAWFRRNHGDTPAS